MDFNNIIDSIRKEINKKNEADRLEELEEPTQIKSLSNYYQNSKIKSFEYGMKKKNRSYYKQPDENKKECCVLEESQTMAMIEQEIESLRYNDWDKLLSKIKNERLNSYVDNLPSMSSPTKKKLKKELKIMLQNRKLTSKKINYNKDKGLIEGISDLVLNNVDDTFSFNK